MLKWKLREGVKAVLISAAFWFVVAFLLAALDGAL
jgi:hypothetical protein